MFIADQYNFQWSDSWMDAFLDYDSPNGISGNYVMCNFAQVWDML